MTHYIKIFSISDGMESAYPPRQLEDVFTVDSFTQDVTELAESFRLFAEKHELYGPRKELVWTCHEIIPSLSTTLTRLQHSPIKENP